MNGALGTITSEEKSGDRLIFSWFAAALCGWGKNGGEIPIGGAVVQLKCRPDCGVSVLHAECAAC